MINYRFKCLVNGVFTDTCEIKRADIEWATYTVPIYIVKEDDTTQTISALQTKPEVLVHNSAFVADPIKLDWMNPYLIETGTSIGATYAVNLTVSYGAELPVNSQFIRVGVDGTEYTIGESFTVRYLTEYYGLFEYDPSNNWYISAGDITKIGTNKQLYILKVSEDTSNNKTYSNYTDVVYSVASNDNTGMVTVEKTLSLIDMPDPLNAGNKTRGVTIKPNKIVSKTIKVSAKLGSATGIVTSDYTLTYDSTVDYGLYYVLGTNDPVSAGKIANTGASIKLYFLSKKVTNSSYILYDPYITDDISKLSVTSITQLPPEGVYPYTLSAIKLDDSTLYKGQRVPYIEVTDTSGVTRDFSLQAKINGIEVLGFTLKPSASSTNEVTRLKNASRIYGCPFTTLDVNGPVYDKKNAVRIDSFSKQSSNIIQNNTFKYCILYDWLYEGVEYTSVYTNKDITDTTGTLQKATDSYYFTYTTASTSLPKTLNVNFKLPLFKDNKPELFRLVNNEQSLPQVINLVTSSDADRTYPTTISSATLKTQIVTEQTKITTFTHKSLLDKATTIPAGHDCINTYNNMSTLYRQYKEIYDTKNSKFAYTLYNENGVDYAVYGGEGINISYRFIIADIQEYLLSNGDLTINNNNLNLCVWIANITNSGEYVNKRSITNISTDVAKGYTNTFINSEFKSLQRDEIYRYGIVFYNKYGIYSTVKWIGDIRTPGISEPGFNTFLNNTGASANPFNSNNNDGVVIRPIGIEFNVKILPEGAVGYEIVRCKRTEADRSIITQGLLSVVMERPETEYTNNTQSLSPSSVLTAHELIEYGGSFYGHRDTGAASRFTRETYSIPKYYTLHSPEICYLKDTYKDLFKDGEIYLCPEMVVWNSERISKDKREDTYLSKSSSLLNNNNILSIPAFDILKTTNESPTNVGDFKDNAPDLDRTNNRAGTNGQLYNFVDYDKNRNVILNSVNSLYSIGYRYCGASIALMYNQASKYNIAPTDSYVGKYVSNAKYKINDIEIALEPTWSDYEKREDFLSGINGRRFNNWCRQAYMKAKLDENDNRTWQALGGRCAILYCDSINEYDLLYGRFLISEKFKYKPSTITANYKQNILRNVVFSGGDTENIWSRTGSVLVNIKKHITPYGGDTYTNRNLSKYISVGCYNTASSAGTYKKEFSGDTFIGMFNFAKTHKFYSKVNAQLYSGITAYSVPIESAINLALVPSKLFTPQSDYTYTFDYNHQIEPSDVSGYFTQKKPLYSYNTIYSVENYVKIMTASSEYDEFNKKLDCRTYYSNIKSNDEIVDSWTKFQPLNYLDVDSKHGSITNIRTFNNELLFWQEDAFGKYAINDRSLITDDTNTGLVLGNGGILTRYDYIATTNGMNKNDIDTQSDNILYWFDYDRQELCAYTGGAVTCISKTKNVQNYINKQSRQNNNAILTYDKQYNELVACLNDTESIIFNEYVNAFTGIYDISYKDSVEFNNGVMLLTDNNKLYTWNKHYFNNNTYSRVNTASQSLIPELKYVVNEIYAGIKVFDNVEFSASEYDVNSSKKGLDVRNTSIKFNTDLITSITTADNKSITSREFSYRLAVPRANNSAIGNRYRGRVLYCDFINNDNTKDIELSYIATKYRISRS